MTEGFANWYDDTNIKSRNWPIGTYLGLWASKEASRGFN